LYITYSADVGVFKIFNREMLRAFNMHREKCIQSF